MKEADNATFLEKVKEFHETDKRYKQILDNPENLSINGRLETLAQLSIEAFDQKNLIELDIAKNDDVTLQVADNDIRETISKIRNGKKFASIYGYEYFYKSGKGVQDEMQKNSCLDDLGFASLNFDELFKHFHSWFYIGDYYISKLQVGPILASKPIPDELKRYFDEIREAYAFGLSNACTSLCRALLEICIVKELCKIGEYQQKLEKLKLEKLNKKRWRDNFNLYQNIEFAFEYKLFDEKTRGEAHDIRETANQVLHISSKQSSNRRSLLEIIRVTVGIVEHFYGL